VDVILKPRKRLKDLRLLSVVSLGSALRGLNQKTTSLFFGRHPESAQAAEGPAVAFGCQPRKRPAESQPENNSPGAPFWCAAHFRAAEWDTANLNQKSVSSRAKRVDLAFAFRVFHDDPIRQHQSCAAG